MVEILDNSDFKVVAMSHTSMLNALVTRGSVSIIRHVAQRWQCI